MKTKGEACYSSSNKRNKIVSLNISYKYFSVVALTAAAIIYLWKYHYAWFAMNYVIGSRIVKIETMEK